ncbi:MAG: DedA family protein [Patescibacteria group bacterium]
MNLDVLLNPELLIKTLGLIGVWAVLFAESGLFFGFFLPGDSLLFTAGVLASQGLINYPILLVVTFSAAILGDNVGYWFGHKVGSKLFEREDSFLFKRHHLLEAQRFYEKNGAKTIVLARFVPFVRTFAPIVAGAAKMHYQTFIFYNFLGGFLWSVGIATLGYLLGNIPIIKHNYEYVIFLIVAASLLPIIIHAAGAYRKRKGSRRVN